MRKAKRKPKYWIVGCGIGVLMCYTSKREADEMVSVLNHSLPSKYMILTAI